MIVLFAVVCKLIVDVGWCDEVKLATSNGTRQTKSQTHQDGQEHWRVIEILSSIVLWK